MGIPDVRRKFTNKNWNREKEAPTFTQPTTDQTTVSSGFPVLYAHWTGEKKTNKNDVYLGGVYGRFPILANIFQMGWFNHQLEHWWLMVFVFRHRYGFPVDPGAEFTLSTLWIGSGQL